MADVRRTERTVQSDRHIVVVGANEQARSVHGPDLALGPRLIPGSPDWSEDNDVPIGAPESRGRLAS